MIQREEFEAYARSEVQQEHGSSLDEKGITAAIGRRWTVFKANAPVARDSFDLAELADVPVIAADDVAAYVASLPKGTRMEDVVASMAPPFEKEPSNRMGVWKKPSAPSNTVDHILTTARGGTTTDDNLRGLCRDCHSRKTAVVDDRWGNR
jgi:hypothetical protein